MFIRSLLAIAVLALPALAQTAPTQAQIQACSNSFVMESYPDTGSYTFDTSDTSPFTASYTYDPRLCTNPQVPLNRITLRDQFNDQAYTCTYEPFGSSGRVVATCSATKRTMAILSKRDGHGDWSVTSNIGQRPTTINAVNEFGVIGTGPVPSPGINTRRSWRDQLKRNFECPVGQSMCPTGLRGRFECRSTSADIYSCGACPGAASTNDCTSIDGVDEVECRSGSCYVKSCEEGWRVSGNNSQCIPSFLNPSSTQ